ncbi:DUF3267 domain-containing protein [Streptococcus panodentis]|uniref:Transcriptional regulator n=1 Tax=Streptococcus panodentis TaxID=1581472 RepID=A0ABS5AUA8_9STRE|nr:DUF3267 domain-containing protein [Streptococcus panodentis]MBP2620161.1 transcriptional regulator [Streptococcus panodentis]
MKILKTIDVLNNKKTALIINIASVLLILPFGAVFGGLAILLWGSGSQDGSIPLGDLIYLFPLILIHELIHGFFFKILGNAETKVRFGFQNGMAYAGSPGSLYSRGRMLIILLAPFVLISLTLTLLYSLHWLKPLSYIALSSIHAAGCIGDFYMTAVILRQKGAIAVEDTAVGITIYQKENTK